MTAHSPRTAVVDCFEQHLVSDETRDLIERLLLERISLREICRAVKVGLKWLLGFIVTCFETLPDHLNVQPISCDQDVMIQRLEVEADEMASFVQKKANKQWIWLAMDVKTREIIAFHIGDRSRKSARKLWAKIPVAYRAQATFYTDQDESRQHWEPYDHSHSLHLASSAATAPTDPVEARRPGEASNAAAPALSSGSYR